MIKAVMQEEESQQCVCSPSPGLPERNFLLLCGEGQNLDLGKKNASGLGIMKSADMQHDKLKKNKQKTTSYSPCLEGEGCCLGFFGFEFVEFLVWKIVKSICKMSFHF